MLTRRCIVPVLAFRIALIDSLISPLLPDPRAPPFNRDVANMDMDALGAFLVGLCLCIRYVYEGTYQCRGGWWTIIESRYSGERAVRSDVDVR